MDIPCNSTSDQYNRADLHIPTGDSLLSKLIQAIRGMNDILPAQSPLWLYLEDQVREVLSVYGYEHIRLPIVEQTALFKRAIGEVTDIVEKEMYTFADRNDELLTLRPEGTAGCVRAGIQHGLLYNQIQRLWYAGPMFRYEKPQKGRYRQFHQIGVEVFGLPGADIDAELIIMTARLWRQLGLSECVSLQINSLGTPDERVEYRQALVTYFTQHKEALDVDSLRRLESNPLRILDSKNPALAELIAGAPRLEDYLQDESKQHFAELCRLLDAVGIVYQINPCLVRGLDYYHRTVFEWVTEALGAQGTVCAGGRYDGLVAQLGGKATPAIGMAMGVERLLALLESQTTLSLDTAPHLYLVYQGEAALTRTLQIAEQIRDALPWLRVQWHVGGGSLKSQFKRADKSGAQLVLIIGEQELSDHSLQAKWLRTDRQQHAIAQDRLIDWLEGCRPLIFTRSN